MLSLLEIITLKRCKTPHDVQWFTKKAAGWHSQCNHFLTGGNGVKFMGTESAGAGGGEMGCCLIGIEFSFHKRKRF